jgi:hypothetical protein
MAYTRTWNAAYEADPADGDNLGEGANRIRDMRVDVRERLAKDHYMDIAGTDAAHGEHSKVTLRTGAKPTAEADKGYLYAKDVTAKAELFYEDEDGNEVQLTTAGALNVATAIATAITAAKEALYPIGCIYTTTVATNPATALGFGTWVAFGAGKVLVGLNASETEFDTVEETGGEKTHILTSNEMPAHTHSFSSPVAATAAGAAVAYNGYSNNAIAATESTGGGVAHNNLQPYIVVYFWKRTV